MSERTCITCGKSLNDKLPHFRSDKGWLTHYFCPMPTKEQEKKFKEREAKS